MGDRLYAGKQLSLMLRTCNGEVARPRQKMADLDTVSQTCLKAAHKFEFDIHSCPARSTNSVQTLNVKMLNAIAIIASKMTSHCVDTVQLREESECGIRK